MCKKRVGFVAALGSGWPPVHVHHGVIKLGLKVSLVAHLFLNSGSEEGILGAWLRSPICLANSRDELRFIEAIH